MKHLVSFHFFLLTILIWTSCNDSHPYENFKIRVDFEEKLSIESNDSLGVSNIYAAEGVALSDDNKIYIADAGDMHIKVYSEEGDYLYSFGKRGRGPGEFISIKGFELINNSIFVWDQSLSRLSKFSLVGDYEQSYQIEGISAPIKIIPFEKNYLLIHPNQYHQESLDKTKLAHFYDEKLKGKKTSFIQLSDINEGIEIANRLIRVLHGSVAKVSEKEILFIPYVYNGYIYRYVKKDPSKWIKAENIRGINKQKPITLLDTQWNKRKPDVSISSIDNPQQMNLLLHNQSRGLLKYRDYYFHFALTDFKNTRSFGAEIYSKNFEPLAYIVIKTIQISQVSNNYLRWFAEEVDRSGNFLFRIRTESGSQIKIMHLDINEVNKAISNL